MMSEVVIPQFSPHTQLSQMISGYWVSQAIYTAAKLGIADLLKPGSQSCQQLAENTDSNPGSLYRMMRALASIGIFQETEPEQFILTPLAEYLCSDHPQSLQATAVMLGDAPHYQAWGNFLYSVKTGKPAFDHSFGMGVFDYFKSHPQDAEIFEQCMNSFSFVEEKAILDVYDFSQFKTLVDIGGGYGEMLGTFLQKYPHLQGILFDEEYVISHAEPTLAKHGVVERCQMVSGDFFTSVPPGGDAYLLKHILHDWDDERALTILKNCRDAMDEHSKILVLEMIVQPGNIPGAAKMLDLNMLVMCPGGKERTESEFHQLFAQAGLKLTEIIRTAEDICVIEGCK
jgi:hypothetical protein